MKVLIHPWVMKMSNKFHLIEPEPPITTEKKKENIADFYDVPPPMKEERKIGR